LGTLLPKFFHYQFTNMSFDWIDSCHGFQVVQGPANTGELAGVPYQGDFTDLLHSKMLELTGVTPGGPRSHQLWDKAIAFTNYSDQVTYTGHNPYNHGNDPEKCEVLKTPEGLLRVAQELSKSEQPVIA
jgi:hypothetical protein